MEFALESGKAVVEGEIGRGPRSVVYRARHDLTDQALAFKVWTDAATAEKFRKLAESVCAAKLTSGPRVHEVGVHEGKPFLCRDFVEGAPVGTGALPAEAAARIARDVALALHEAHQAGIVHGGIKPQNVLLAPDGAAVVVDFRTTVGPPAELRPPEKTHDERADLYALGKLLEKMLGSAPPPALAPILRKATEPNPGDRYLKAKNMADDLARFIRGGQVIAAPVAGEVRAARWLTGNRSAIVGVAGLVVIALLVWFGFAKKSKVEDARAGLGSSDPAARREAIVRVLAEAESFQGNDRDRALGSVADAMMAMPDDETRAAVVAAIEKRGAALDDFLRSQGGLALLQWLKVEKPAELRPRILRLLARGKFSAAKEQMLPFLSSPDAELRRAALAYFTEVPDSRAYGGCARALAEIELRDDALKAVRAQYDGRAISMFHPSEARGFSSQVPYFLQKEAEGDDRFKEVLARELWSDARTHVDAALIALQSPDAETRLRGAAELGLHKDKKGRGPLFLAAMRDPDAGIAAVAAWALGECGADEYKSRLATFLADPRPSTRRQAACLLGAIGDPQFVGAVKTALDKETDGPTRAVMERAAAKLSR